MTLSLNSDELLKIVRDAFPEQKIRNYRIIDSGWDNYVVVVDDETAFKIPRDESNVSRLETEISVLSCLKDSPLPVPDFEYVSRAGFLTVGGYKLIRGVPLNSMSSLREAVIKQLSDFLNFLHKVSDEPCVYGIFGKPSTADWIERYRGYRETIFATLFEVLDDDTLSMIAGYFDRFLKDQCPGMEMSLIHGDLYRGNVLVDEKSGELTGVIDWGNSCIGDPALDFAALAVDFPIEEVEEILLRYEGDMDSNFRSRVEFYWKMEPIYGVIYFLHSNPEYSEIKRRELIKKLNTELF